MMFADGMPSPGLDPGVVCFVLVGLIAVGVARRLGASRWLAFLIPVVPLMVWLVYDSARGEPSEGGSLPLWEVAGPIALICAIAAFIVPKKNIPQKMVTVEDTTLPPPEKKPDANR
jgi:hypothetical protein